MVCSYLDEGVDVQHERLSPADDELVDAGDGVRPAAQTFMKDVVRLTTTGRLASTAQTPVQFTAGR